MNKNINVMKELAKYENDILEDNYIPYKKVNKIIHDHISQHGVKLCNTTIGTGAIFFYADELVEDRTRAFFLDLHHIQGCWKDYSQEDHATNFSGTNVVQTCGYINPSEETFLTAEECKKMFETLAVGKFYKVWFSRDCEKIRVYDDNKNFVVIR